MVFGIDNVGVQDKIIVKGQKYVSKEREKRKRQHVVHTKCLSRKNNVSNLTTNEQMNEQFRIQHIPLN